MGFKHVGFVSRILPVLLIIWCCIAGMACGSKGNVTYEATGDADTVDITVMNGKGVTEQYMDVKLPWRMDYSEFGASQLYMYVYNNGDSGTIKITVYVDGKLTRTAACSGPYANAVINVER